MAITSEWQSADGTDRFVPLTAIPGIRFALFLDMFENIETLREVNQNPSRTMRLMFLRLASSGLQLPLGS